MAAAADLPVAFLPLAQFSDSAGNFFATSAVPRDAAV